MAAAASFAFLSAGNNSPLSVAIIAITTRNSIKENRPTDLTPKDDFTAASLMFFIFYVKARLAPTIAHSYNNKSGDNNRNERQMRLFELKTRFHRSKEGGWIWSRKCLIVIFLSS